MTGDGVNEHGHFWASRPSRWLIVASAADFVVVTALAVHGVLMAAVSLVLVAGLMATAAVYLAVLDFVKIRLFRRLGIG